MTGARLRVAVWAVLLLAGLAVCWMDPTWRQGWWRAVDLLEVAMIPGVCGNRLGRALIDLAAAAPTPAGPTAEGT